MALRPLEHARNGLEPSPSASAPASVDDTYSDSRRLGEYQTKYPRSAWVQIGLEGLYLLLVLIATIACLLILALRPDIAFDQADALLKPKLLSASLQREFQVWATVFFSGMAGATSFAIKWLYHSVAWKKWNRDRVIWRLSVPLQGGVLATFTGAMIVSGLIPLLNKGIFVRLVSCTGYGFLVGLFADNFLAALEKFAGRILGTLGRSE